MEVWCDEAKRHITIVRRVVVLAAVGALMASCGSSDDTSSTVSSPTTGETTSAAPTTSTASTADSTASGSSAAPSGDVCADRDALRSSVAALTDVDLVAEGTNGVKTAISAVKDDLTALKASAGSELRPEVQAVQDGIDQLETAVDAGSAAQAATALTSVAGAATTLLDSLENRPCAPSTTPTT